MKVDIDKLRALCDAATPGPWEWNDGFLWNVEHDTGVLSHSHIPEDNACQECSAGTRWPISDENKAFIAAARAAVPELLDEITRLRETLAHSCTCSLADGAAPALRHEESCELRIAKTKRIDPALALSRFAAAMDALTEDEVEELKAKLAAMTAARDGLLSAVQSNVCICKGNSICRGTKTARGCFTIRNFRAVGKEQP